MVKRQKISLRRSENCGQVLLLPFDFGGGSVSFLFFLRLSRSALLSLFFVAGCLPLRFRDESNQKTNDRPNWNAAYQKTRAIILHPLAKIR